MKTNNLATFAFILTLIMPSLATAQTSFLNFETEESLSEAVEPATPTTGASGNLVCSTGSKVTLSRIAANPELKENLKAFMSGIEFKEGGQYKSELQGSRKDPGACAGLFGPIDLAGCQKYKPAGHSRFQVVGGEVQYLADGQGNLIPVTLKKICSDGVSKMSFQFHYDQQFLTVRAGPWDYTITVSKKDGMTQSNIMAHVLDDGRKVRLNKAPITVGPMSATYKNAPAYSVDQYETTSGAVR